MSAPFAPLALWVTDPQSIEHIFKVCTCGCMLCHASYHDPLRQQLVLMPAVISKQAAGGRTTTALAVIRCARQTGFATFEKGAEVRDRLGLLLGNGIFVSDGHAWKWMRKMVVGMLGLRR